MRHFICLFFLLGYSTTFLVAQTTYSPNTKTEDKDVYDFFIKKNRVEPNDTVLPPKKLLLGLLPVLSYNPATALQIGVASNAGWFLGHPRDTRISSAIISAIYTTKNQFLIVKRSNVFSRQDKWNFQGEWRLFYFSQATYGLATGTSIDNEDPMLFNLFRFYETAYKRIKKNFYVGLGYHLDYHFNIREQIISDDKRTTYYWSNRYNQSAGIDTAQHTASALGLSVLYDTRDNPINPYKGTYLLFNFRHYDKTIGSVANWEYLHTEWRHYINLSPAQPRHLLAFWTTGIFTFNGTPPYMALPALGWDTYSRGGRGYVQGRFRGADMITAEVEYRFPISANGLIGGVVFSNATTASNSNNYMPIVRLFDKVEPAVGGGLRIKLNKYSRTNICIDYGIGNRYSGLFLNIQEVF
jgi:hypothetical protein